jgi:hypothetical protein
VSRRTFPIPVLGPLCLGMKGLVGCGGAAAPDPILGDWVLAERDGVEMPLEYTDGSACESYGYAYTYTSMQGATLTIFDDFLGQFSEYYSEEMEMFFAYEGMEIQQTSFYSESDSKRVWVRPGELAGSYQITAQDGGILDCMLTSSHEVLECEEEEGESDQGASGDGDTAGGGWDTARETWDTGEPEFARDGYRLEFRRPGTFQTDPRSEIDTGPCRDTWDRDTWDRDTGRRDSGDTGGQTDRVCSEALASATLQADVLIEEPTDLHWDGSTTDVVGMSGEFCAGTAGPGVAACSSCNGDRARLVDRLHFYRFTTSFEFSISATLCDENTDFDTVMALFSGDGTLQLNNDDMDEACGQCNDGYGWESAEIQCPDALLAAGAYVLAVGGFSGAQGTYGLNLSITSP